MVHPPGLPSAGTPGWGTHLIDVNVQMGDVVALVHDQIAAYTGT
jgi:hypothetical protein